MDVAGLILCITVGAIAVGHVCYALGYRDGAADVRENIPVGWRDVSNRDPVR